MAFEIRIHVRKTLQLHTQQILLNVSSVERKRQDMKWQYIWKKYGYRNRCCFLYRWRTVLVAKEFFSKEKRFLLSDKINSHVKSIFNLFKIVLVSKNISILLINCWWFGEIEILCEQNCSKINLVCCECDYVCCLYKPTKEVREEIKTKKRPIKRKRLTNCVFFFAFFSKPSCDFNLSTIFFVYK